MPTVLDPFRFVLIVVAGWMNQRQLQMIEYLREENRVLREQLSERRLRLTDDQRRRLAARAKGLGRKVLAELATIVTPEIGDRFWARTTRSAACAGAASKAAATSHRHSPIRRAPVIARSPPGRTGALGVSSLRKLHSVMPSPLFLARDEASPMPWRGLPRRAARIPAARPVSTRRPRRCAGLS